MKDKVLHAFALDARLRGHDGEGKRLTSPGSAAGCGRVCIARSGLRCSRGCAGSFLFFVPGSNAALPARASRGRTGPPDPRP